MTCSQHPYYKGQGLMPCGCRICWEIWWQKVERTCTDVFGRPRFPDEVAETEKEHNDSGNYSLARITVCALGLAKRRLTESHGLVQVGPGQWQARGVRSIFATPTEPTPLPNADIRQGCPCDCCDHGEFSDCGCECHAEGACSFQPTEPTPLKRGGEDVTPRRGGEPTPPPVDHGPKCQCPTCRPEIYCPAVAPVKRCGDGPCQHFRQGEVTFCINPDGISGAVPADGSGFCHLHEEVTK